LIDQVGSSYDVKKFYALALFTLALIVNARAQEPAQPMTRPRRTQPTQEQQQPAPQATPTPTPQQTQAPTSQTPIVPEEAHDYAPIREREIVYKNWSYKPASKGEAVNLREWARGKRLVLVAYFAPWCRNSKLEIPVVAELYNKYHAQGFDVIVVEEYGTAEEVKNYLAGHPAPFAFVVESTSQDARAKTTHYAYRQQAGDTRKWGTPFNVFLDPATLNERGDALAPKVWTANGELIAAEAERFIRERLGLPATP
jgi:thiol-disulfide isomerase/thioredoxin